MNRVISYALSRALIDRRGGHRRDVLRAFRDRCAFHSKTDAVRTSAALAGMLEHARDHAPHFKNLIGPGTRIGPDNAYEILARLPRMTREEIQRDLPSFLAADRTPAADDATGGSSGTPMSFKVDRDTQIAREASLMWADSLAGWRAGERIAMLWGSDRDVHSAGRHWRIHARNWIENKRWFNAFDMGPDRMEQFHRALTEFDPHLLVAYAGSAHVFAQFLAQRGLSPAYPRTAIISSAEMLSPAIRAAVEKVFPAPVFDRYGNREFGAIAAECSLRQGLHVNEADCIVEVDSSDPVRVPGAILVTYLQNRVMPFIRYDTGDLGLWREENTPCACGRKSRRLDRIVGRESDTIRTSDGRLIHGEYFTHLLYGCNGVTAFRFIQSELDRFVLQVSGDPEAVRNQTPAWVKAIQREVGAGAELTVEYVDRIPPLPSGKRKFTLSLVEK